MSAEETLYTNMGYEGAGPWPYRKLSGSDLISELSRAANAQTVHGTDIVCKSFLILRIPNLNFYPKALQPCTLSRSQDRFLVSQLDVPGGQWGFYGVFDGKIWRMFGWTPLTQSHCLGHAGEETVDYVVESLPSILRNLLAAALEASGENRLNPEVVSDVLINAISEVDNIITREILDIFPGGIEALEALSDAQIDAIVNDFGSGGANNAKLIRGMRGSTVLVSLIDPSGSDLYVASLGDCQAGWFAILFLDDIR